MSSYSTIGTPVTSSTSVSSTAFVTNANLNVGELGVARYVCSAASRPAGLAVVDDAGNTWAIAIDGGNGTSSYTCIFWTVATVLLVSGSNIIVNTTAGQTFRGLDVIKATNPASSTPLVAAPTKFASGTGTAISAGASAAPGSSDWLGAVAIDFGSASVLPGSVGGTWIEDVDVGAVGFETQSLIGTSTGNVGGGGTGNTSAAWACSVAIFSLGTAAAASTPTPRTAIPFTQGAGGGAFGGAGPH